MIIIFSEYWRYNPNYGKAVELFQYYDLLILFIGVGAAASWFIKKPRKNAIKYLNGLTIFLSMLFLDIIAVNRFTTKESGLNFTVDGLFSHLGHIIGVAICLFLVYVLVRVLGALFTTIFPLRISNVDLPLIQVAIGIMVFTSLLFFLGLIGMLNPFIIIPICLIVLAFYWRYTFKYFKETLLTPIKIPKELNVLGIFSFLFLAIFLILNFAQILRPFPIGSDSLRLYVNLPSLIAEYGGLVDGHQPYNWSLFMTTGLVVFGRMDVVLAISFFGGLLSIFALFQLSKKWLDVNYSALVLLLFYSLPMVNFLSYMDMKIDMGLLFFTLATLLLYYNWVNPIDNEIITMKGIGLSKAKSFFKDRIPPVLQQNRILVLIGLLSGFAFGIKFTVLFFVLALYCTIWFFKGNKLTFIASFCLCFAAIFLLQLDVQPGLRQFHQNVPILQWSLLAIGIGLLAYLYFKQKKKVLELLTYSLIIGVFFALPILPWLGKNLSETGKVSVTALLNGKKASPIFKLGNVKKNSKKDEVVIPGLYQMPDVPEVKGKKRKRKAKSGVSEDLHRFMGYEIVPIRYLSLPYDVFIKTNITNFFIDVGFVLLLLFPILFLFSSGNNFDWKSLLANLSFIGLSTLLLIIAIPSAFLNQNNLLKSSDGLALLESNESSGFLGNISDMTNITLLNIYGPINDWLLSVLPVKDSVTYPLLLLLFLCILAIVFIRIKRHSKVTQSIIVFVLMYFFLWWILGSGASWYGMLLFCIPFIFLFKSIPTIEGKEKMSSIKSLIFGSLKRNVFLSIAMVWVFLAFTHRAANYIPADKERATRLYFPPIMKYTMGEINEKKLMDYHFPNVRKLVEGINKDRKSLVYMIGSPYNYFINRNDSRVLSDTYLDFFEGLVRNYKTKDQIINALKTEGFKYIIFDLKMTTYDVTPGKTLTRKFTQFMNTLYNNPGVELVATDRKIKLNATGEEVFEVFQDKGTIVHSGDIAIFKIK